MRVLITAGNTIVPIDEVRCISNVFRGRTGTRIALEACRRGHRVHLLASDPDLVSRQEAQPPSPDRFSVQPYRTYEDLHQAMRQAIGQAAFDVLIHSAA